MGLFELWPPHVLEMEKIFIRRTDIYQAHRSKQTQEQYIGKAKSRETKNNQFNSNQFSSNQ